MIVDKQEQKTERVTMCHDARTPTVQQDAEQLAEIAKRLDRLSIADADADTRSLFFATIRNLSQLASSARSELEFRESTGMDPETGLESAETHVYVVTNPEIPDDEPYTRRHEKSPTVIATSHEPYLRSVGGRDN